MSSKIEWTEETWNPTTGCTKISAGCKNCYAETMSARLKAMRILGYENGFELTLVPSRLDKPLKTKRPTTYFVNSMSDLFHEEIPFDYIDCVIDVIERTPQHTYQLLTKRAERMCEYFHENKIPQNAWLGVTAENKKHGIQRIDFLRTLNAVVKFVSIEPLLEDLGELNLTNIDWVIVGGESGTNARPMKEEWALNIQKQCKKQDVAFFFKQWGTWGADNKKRSKKANGKLLNGKIIQEMPNI